MSSISSNAGGSMKQTIHTRLDARIADMKEKRKRGLKMIYKKEGRLSDFEHGFKTLIARKQQILKKFTSEQLENQIKGTLAVREE
jgi:soluble cytochrome b562